VRSISIATTVCLLLGPATVHAQEKRYPPEVRAVLAEARKACSKEGGKRVEFDRKAVRRVELTGDGRDDFIIDLTYTRCVDREYAFCGSAGCDFAIVVSKRGRGYARDANGTVMAFHHTPGYETYRGLGWYGVILQGSGEARR